MDELETREIMILVSSGTTSLAAGARQVFDALTHELQSRNLSNVTVKMVGEKGIASSEPIVEIHRKGEPVFAYGHMTPEKVERLIDEHIIKDTPILDWIIGICDKRSGG